MGDHVDINRIIDLITFTNIPNNATVTQVKHEEDDDYYGVWKIEYGSQSYIIKESKGNEAKIHTLVSKLVKNGVPHLYEIITAGEKQYLVMEYADGENLTKCNREKLILALDALISVQKATWGAFNIEDGESSFAESLKRRINRGKYLNDPILEEAYESFLSRYRSTPRALCHDDLLPFNIIATEDRAYLIDWEIGGALPYPTSFARLIAHTSSDEDTFLYMTKEDKSFATRYYYDNLLKEKGIAYGEWINTLEYFTLYEYCEWVYVGNKYGTQDGELYKKYFPLAKSLAERILISEKGKTTK